MEVSKEIMEKAELEGAKAIQHFVNREQSKFTFEWANMVRDAYIKGYKEGVGFKDRVIGEPKHNVCILSGAKKGDKFITRNKDIAEYVQRVGDGVHELSINRYNVTFLYTSDGYWSPLRHKSEYDILYKKTDE